MKFKSDGNRFGSRGGKNVFSFVHVTFEISTGHLSGKFKQIIDCKRSVLEATNMGVEKCMLFKAMG